MCQVILPWPDGEGGAAGQTGGFIRTGSFKVRQLINAAEGLVCSILHGDAETQREHNPNVSRCGPQRRYF